MRPHARFCAVTDFMSKPLAIFVSMRAQDALKVRRLALISWLYEMSHKSASDMPYLPHALWSAFFSQWARNAAHALMAEASVHGNGSKLWRLPPCLIAAMRSIGSAYCFGGGNKQQRRFYALLEAIESVRWQYIDPSFSCWPTRNAWGHQCIKIATSFRGIEMDWCRWSHLHFGAERPLLLEAKFGLAIWHLIVNWPQAGFCDQPDGRDISLKNSVR